MRPLSDAWKEERRLTRGLQRLAGPEQGNLERFDRMDQRFKAEACHGEVAFMARLLTLCALSRHSCRKPLCPLHLGDATGYVSHAPAHSPTASQNNL